MAVPAGAVTSMKASTRPPGASTSAPLRARNGSAGWLSMAITRTSCPSNFDCNDSALAAVDEAKPEPFVGPG